MGRSMISIKSNPQIHFEGHCNGWAIKIEVFWGPEMAASEASAIWANLTNSKFWERKNKNIICYPLIVFNFLRILGVGASKKKKLLV